MKSALNFPPDARLKKRTEFNTVYKMGCKFNTPHFLLLIIENKNNKSRLGITVSKKVGNSVIRNRIKRVLREFFRINNKYFIKPVDLSIIAKRGAGQIKNIEINEEINQYFK